MCPPTCPLAVLLALLVVSPALAEEREARFTKAVTEAFNKSESAYIGSVPHVLQLRDAAKAFTDVSSDAETVAFLKKAALKTDGSKSGRAEQLTGFIGLALLSEKHDTVSFLKSHLADKNALRSRYAFVGISFLPTKDARGIAEEVVIDTKQNWHTRIEFLFLLRSVGDQGTLMKLEKLARGNESPRVLEVRDRTAWFIGQRLSLKHPAERDRWVRQELVFLRMGYWGPDFRSGRMGLAWAAEQIHRCERDVAVELLKSRLSLERPRTQNQDYNMSHEVPLAAAIAGLQGNTELLPLLDAWAATDFGFVSGACAEAATQLRGGKKD